ncbi:hypothetical protein ALQ47_200063 [Pseudomonas cichorii]|nr:hypothetical protein ALQ47_200063 [Pseudomonas cichorii]
MTQAHDGICDTLSILVQRLHLPDCVSGYILRSVIKEPLSYLFNGCADCMLVMQ